MCGEFSPPPQNIERKMSETIQQLADAFATWQAEDAKFTEKGNKAAGTRARKALLEIGKLTKVRRAEISEAKAEG
jgi:hypothetical protein